MTTEFDILERQFEAYGPDAPFFAEIARQSIEAEHTRGVLIAAIGRTIQHFVDDVWPKPEFTRPNLFSSEEDLDVRMMELEAQDYSDALARARQSLGDAVLPADRRHWYMMRLDQLAEAYVAGAKI